MAGFFIVLAFFGLLMSALMVAEKLVRLVLIMVRGVIRVFFVVYDAWGPAK